MPGLPGIFSFYPAYSEGGTPNCFLKEVEKWERVLKPVYELKGFAKTKNLKPGASETLTITIDPYTLASFNEETSAWEPAAGAYTAHFGASVADIRATAPFKLAKAQSWPAHRVMLPAEPVEEIKVK